MLTVSRLVKSNVLVLLATTLTTAVYAGGGGHSASNGSGNSPVHNSSFVHSVTVHSATVHSSVVPSRKTVVSKHGGKLPKGSVVLSGRHSSPHNDPAIVRDHRRSDDEVGNTVGGLCDGGCVGQGGLKGGAQPAQNQDHSTGSGAPKVTDHRSGG